MYSVITARLVPERVTAMREILYAHEKIREIESQLDGARTRYSVPAVSVAELAGPVFRRAGAALSRLVTAVRSGRDRAEPATVHSALLEGRGPR